MTKIAVLASGEGTNLQVLLDACLSGRVNGKVVLVVASKPRARLPSFGRPKLMSPPVV